VSNDLDRTLLVELRKQADVIVTSGATARAENLRASKHAPIFVLTLSGRIDGLERLLSSADCKPVSLVVPAAIESETRHALEHAGLSAKVIGLQSLEPARVKAFLLHEGMQCILLEFGPMLAQLWLNATAIDEVCLTTTGIELGEVQSVNPESVEPNGALARTSDSLPTILRWSGARTLVATSTAKTINRYSSDSH
jgi:5-amino-6-(5-phosphoribosylamino)uracil reductase